VSPEQVLARLGRVTERAPFAYATSWPIEEVRLTRPDGRPLTVLVKRFARTTDHEKPAALIDPDREPCVYPLLAGLGVATARCYAAGAGWIVLEKLPGVPLWQSGALADWCRAARWAAELHARCASTPLRGERLLCHDRRHYEAIIGRARALTP
jgi:hypothetical protein